MTEYKKYANKLNWLKNICKKNYFSQHFDLCKNNLKLIPLTYIYNQSIETGIVPDILKVSQVSPVYKCGDATDPSNYRPIATLSPFSKVLERLVYNQLYSFIDKHQILYKYQFISRPIKDI